MTSHWVFRMACLQFMSLMLSCGPRAPGHDSILEMMSVSKAGAHAGKNRQSPGVFQKGISEPDSCGLVPSPSECRLSFPSLPFLLTMRDMVASTSEPANGGWVALANPWTGSKDHSLPGFQCRFGRSAPSGVCQFRRMATCSWRKQPRGCLQGRDESRGRDSPFPESSPWLGIRCGPRVKAEASYGINVLETCSSVSGDCSQNV